MIRAEHDTSSKLVWALLLASFFHLTLVAFLISYDPIEKVEEEKTIPVMLINSAPSQASVSQQASQSSSQVAESSQEILRTQGESIRRVLDPQDSPKKTQQSRSKASNSSPMPQLPEITRESRRQANQANLTSKQWQTLTQQRQSRAQKNSPASKKQISTTEKPLTDFELKLVQHIDNAISNSPFYRVIFKYGIKKVELELSIRLLQNGQIKKADFISSSSIDEINSTLRKIIYDANPYPRPPNEDSVKNFEYNIPITLAPEF